MPNSRGFAKVASQSEHGTEEASEVAMSATNEIPEATKDATTATAVRQRSLLPPALQLYISFPTLTEST